MEKQSYPFTACIKDESLREAIDFYVAKHVVASVKTDYHNNVMSYGYLCGALSILEIGNFITREQGEQIRLIAMKLNEQRNDK